MSDENKQAPVFNAQTESGNIEQAMRIVHGDEVSGNKDASQHQGETNISGGMSGSITNENTINNDVVTIQEALQNVLAEASKICEGAETTDELPEKFEPLPFDTFEDGEHPDQLSEQLMAYSSMAPEAIQALPEKETDGFVASFKSSMEKIAPVAKTGFFKSCKVAIKALTVISGPAWPYSLSLGILEGIVENFGGEE